MKQFWLRRFLAPRFGSRGRAQRPRRASTPRLEPLEERSVPTLSVTNLTITPVEGTSGTFTVATFTDTDPSPVADYSATIDWGDGTATTTGTITQNGGTFSVTGNHVYADETASASPLPVKVQIQESNGSDQDHGTANSTANVSEGDVLKGTGVTLPAVEGHSFTGTVASFTDTDTATPASAFAATIDWGDGTTTTGTVSGSAGDFTVTGTHTFAEDGSLPVSVRLTENSPGTATATASSTAAIAENGLTITSTTITAQEGHSFSGTVATFADPGSSDPAGAFTVSIDWGDGSSSTGTVTGSGGSFTVSGSHTYADEGNFPVAVKITETGITGTTTASSTAMVSETDTLAATGTAVKAIEGQTVSGEVATFTTTGTAASAGDFAATIDWGDGTTTAGTVSGSNGSFSVKGSHSYADEGSFTVKVTIKDDGTGTASATATSTATVADAALAATGTTLNLTVGVAANNVAVGTFTDPAPEPVGNYTATIDFGDNSAAAQGTVSFANGTFTVTTSHTYSSQGTFTLTVTIKDEGGNTATITTTVVVAHVPSWLDRVYRDFFHRAVDPTGQVGWTKLLNQGVSRQLIIDMIEQSLEYRTDEVQNLYQQLLHRSADATGIEVNVSALASGATILDIEESILGSPEFLQNAGSTNLGFVNALFEIVLHRAPEPGAQGLAVSALNQGMSRQAVAAVVVNSDEFHGDLVNTLYEQYLLRAPDPGAFAQSVQALRAGFSQEGLIAVLFGSDEYLANSQD